MRGLVQRCDIKIHNLITFGSPHAGVSAIPNCFASSSSACNIAKSLVDSGAYLPFIQSRVVQAQYYRISSRPEIFKEKCILLPDLNQMNQIKDVYKQKFQSLNSFVMVMFLNDSVIIPKESAHFAYFNENMELVQLEGQELWKDDLLGLQRLNVQGKLIRTTLSGSHVIPLKIISYLFVDEFRYARY